jgi:hypothetical protein
MMIYKKNLFGEVKEMKIDINDIYIDLKKNIRWWNWIF